MNKDLIAKGPEPKRLKDENDVTYYCRSIVEHTGIGVQVELLDMLKFGFTHLGFTMYYPSYDNPDFVLMSMEGVGDYGMYYFEPKVPEVKEFRDLYEEKFGSLSNEEGNGWDANKLLQMILSYCDYKGYTKKKTKKKSKVS